MTLPLFLNPFLVATALDGTISSGAKLYFYETGTLTLADIYDSAGTPIANPVVADANGRFADVFLGATGQEYRVKLTTSSGTLITEVDPYTSQDITTLLADTDGSDLIGYQNAATGSVAQTVQDTINQQKEVYPETFGAVGDGTTNDATALQAWLDAIGAGNVGVLPPKTYKFNTALTRTDGVDGITIKGHGPKSILLYAGGSTTVNLITIGSTSVDTTGVVIKDLRIESSTTMTDGAALKVYRTYFSNFEDITYGGQYGNNKIWHGLDLEAFSQVIVDGFDVYGQGNGIQASALRTAAVTNAGNLFIKNGKIGQMGLRGILIGGGVDSAYFSDIDVRECGQDVASSGVTINNSLCNAANNYIVFNGGVNVEGNAASGITINDPLSTAGWFHLNGISAVSNTVNGVYVQEAGTSSVTVSGSKLATNLTNGLRNTSDSSVVLVNGCDFVSNGNYGINSNGNDHTTIEVYASGCRFSGNVSGDVDGGIVVLRGTVTDAGRYSAWASNGDPIEYFDTNDYMKFNRASNQWEFYIGGVLAGHINAATGFVND